MVKYFGLLTVSNSTLTPTVMTSSSIRLSIPFAAHPSSAQISFSALSQKVVEKQVEEIVLFLGSFIRPAILSFSRDRPLFTISYKVLFPFRCRPDSLSVYHFFPSLCVVGISRLEVSYFQCPAGNFFCCCSRSRLFHKSPGGTLVALC